jgi:hypothetical protein
MQIVVVPRLLCLAISGWSLVASCRADTFTPPAIPMPNHVEIIALDAAPGIAMTKLSRKRGRSLVTLIERLKWIRPGNDCDKAEYELRFYSGKKLDADRIISFRRGCFAPAKGDPHSDATTLAFDTSDPSAARLQHYLQKLFPERK